MFKIVCQFLLNFMNLLNSWLHDYGLAILALTPSLNSRFADPKQSQPLHAPDGGLSPKMQSCAKKYKRSNPDESGGVKLYKQYGINPVGGCLPMMIQIPSSSAFSKCLVSGWNCETRSFSGSKTFLSLTL